MAASSIAHFAIIGLSIAIRATRGKRACEHGVRNVSLDMQKPACRRHERCQ
jgi:hypothetical protein